MKKKYAEIVMLGLIAIIVFIVSILQVDDIVSIWNQNDEFGVWEGAAWVLGLDWSEVASTNAYYGYGYGFILALFVKLFGYNTVLMTQLAICFQALMHTGCIFIALYCIKKLLPEVNAITRLIASTICILTIPDLFYIYMIFSECLLRFIVWAILGMFASYYSKKKLYKLVLIDFIAIYAFSVHQRCILLVAITTIYTVYEIISYLKCKGFNIRSMACVSIVVVLVISFYLLEYKYAQKSYIDDLYSVGNSGGVGWNLLSERGYTIKGILQDVVFNLNTEKIAMQNIFGFIYYICAFDCGFVAYGFIFCYKKIKNTISNRKIDNCMPYLLMSTMTLIGILLVVYQNANEGVYDRVELMHYGRYCSYLFAPMIMFGILELLTQPSSVIRRNANYVIALFIVAGIFTYNVLKSNNVVSLYAFANTCPGILSVYYDENPYVATLYHTLLGCVWIMVPVLIIIVSNKYCKIKKYIQVGIFVIIAIVWIIIGNKEWKFTHNLQNIYVIQTYDLQSVLQEEIEFVAFKSYSYGSGLLQYNNPYSKIHICKSLDDFTKIKNGLLVVSQKGIDEMDYIRENYSIIYENDWYFVWKYIH